MKKKLQILILSIIASIFLISGCVQQTNTETPGHISTNKTGEITFLPYQFLYDGVTGYEYRITFCEPEPREGATCGGIEPATNPIGGRPPYSFSVGYGAGLLPPGMKLNLNGVFEGKPKIAGKYDFEICARDGFENQACNTYTLRVNDPIYLTVYWSGEGGGEISWDNAIDDAVCEDTDDSLGYYVCTVPTSLNTEMTSTVKPGDGSQFVGWYGDCSGTGDCSLLMDENKAVIAVFSLVEQSPPDTDDDTDDTVDTDTGPAVDTVKITIDTPIGFTCRVDPPSLGSGWSESRYYTVVASGTMSGGSDTASADISVVETETDGERTPYGVWKLDCGEWKLNDEYGYYPD